MYKITPLIVLLFFLACCSDKKDTKKEMPNLSDEQKSEIEDFSYNIVEKLNEIDFSILKKSWSNNAFKVGVFNQLNKSQRGLFDSFFETEIKKTIQISHLDIIHKINNDQGKAILFNLNHYDHHSELLILLTFDGVFDFIRFRIEIVNNKPRLTDFFKFIEDKWYSKKILGMIRKKTNYRPTSLELRRASKVLSESQELLDQGDTLAAIKKLEEIPTTYENGELVNMDKLKLAAELKDYSVIKDALTKYQKNRSVYELYLGSYYRGDTSQMHATVYQMLATEPGQSDILDSLINNSYIWEINDFFE